MKIRRAGNEDETMAEEYNGRVFGIRWGVGWSKVPRQRNPYIGEEARSPHVAKVFP
jgi:hypothetical protein